MYNKLLYIRIRRTRQWNIYISSIGELLFLRIASFIACFTCKYRNVYTCIRNICARRENHIYYQVHLYSAFTLRSLKTVLTVSTVLYQLHTFLLYAIIIVSLMKYSEQRLFFFCHIYSLVYILYVSPWEVSTLLILRPLSSSAISSLRRVVFLERSIARNVDNVDPEGKTLLELPRISGIIHHTWQRGGVDLFRIHRG